jgi:DNA-directed RNA polymerase III subunit RPC3
VLLEDSADLIDKPGDAGGGQFNLDYSKVFENLACASLDSIVLERFGSKALRLFRWIRNFKNGSGYAKTLNLLVSHS